ncbi:MAG: histidine phosphatase family protein [Deltaproteobacteria bacterium]|nr:histidine phosphatase family protein [Deltaproteobacteria bacterium]
MRRARVVVVRHGETDWNVAGRMQGHTDTDLNERGRAQAQALAELLVEEGIGRIIASDLARARQTAQIIAGRLGLAVETDALLRERKFGIFEGLSWEEIAERHPDWYARYRADHWADIPGAEALTALRERSWEALVRHARHARPGAPVLVVTHGGVLRSMLVRLMGDNAPRPVLNAVPYVFRLRQGQPAEVELPKLLPP